MKSKGKGLLLFGTVGTGKSYIAACIVNALIDAGYSGKVTNFGRIANDLQGTFKREEYLGELNRCDILVVDDLDTERNTEYMNEIVYNVIDGRYQSGKPLIITTNLKSDDFKTHELSKSRVYSRLMECCIPVEVKGKDRRFEKMRSTYADDLNLLKGE